jgi:short-subunit dehydrogenase
MRKQRAGHVISISSGAGLVGFEFNTAYAAAKSKSRRTGSFA